MIRRCAISLYSTVAALVGVFVSVGVVLFVAVFYGSGKE